MKPKNIKQGGDLYDTACRIGREKYTRDKFDFYQVENHPDARSRLMNEWIEEARNELDGDLDTMEGLTFESGFLNGIEKARNGTKGGNIVVG